MPHGIIVASVSTIKGITYAVVIEHMERHNGFVLAGICQCL